MEQNITASTKSKTLSSSFKAVGEYGFPSRLVAEGVIKNNKTPSDFVLPGFIAGTVGALIAPGSTGKSMLAMELSAVVAGASILGDAWTPAKNGEVNILAVEDPENELCNRWIDFGQSLTDSQKKCLSKVYNYNYKKRWPPWRNMI
jgi:hypothetical protein